MIDSIFVTKLHCTMSCNMFQKGDSFGNSESVAVIDSKPKPQWFPCAQQTLCLLHCMAVKRLLSQLFRCSL